MARLDRGGNRTMYAVIKTGGKQYRIGEGSVLAFEKLKAEPGQKVEFDEVLLFSGDGDEMRVGTPYLDSVRVSGTVLEHGKGKKVIIFKYKAKKDYRKKQGHRQPYTLVEMDAITVDGREISLKKEADAPDEAAGADVGDAAPEAAVAAAAAAAGLEAAGVDAGPEAATAKDAGAKAVKAAPKKAAAKPKADKADKAEGAEAAKSPAPRKAAAKPKADKAEGGEAAKSPAPKRAAAKTADSEGGDAVPAREAAPEAAAPEGQE
jgi:large subunit ribosomal protein L21